jgi:hypothetical protein
MCHERKNNSNKDLSLDYKQIKCALFLSYVMRYFSDGNYKQTINTGISF